MTKNLGWRFTIITVVVAFMCYHAYQAINGATQEDRIELGIDLQGGSELIFKFKFATVSDAQKKDTLGKAIEVIEQRVDGYGLKDIVLQPIGSDRFSVQISAKDTEQVNAVKGLITVLGNLEFRITVEPGEDSFDGYWERFRKVIETGTREELVAARTVKPSERLESDIDNGLYEYGLRWYELTDNATQRYSSERLPPPSEDGQVFPWVLCRLDKHNVIGDDLQNIRAHPRMQSGQFVGDWVVSFEVTKNRQTAMAGLTATQHDNMAVILNGQVETAPDLQSTLSQSGQIYGGFSEKQSRSLAAVLQAGALTETPSLISESTIAPELAGGARSRGILSIAIGFIAVLVYMAFAYLGPGLLANLALLLNLVILVGVLNWFDAVLTLPGLAGVVLTIGMAVDANILVFERIREEKARGRGLAQAVSTGYDRALVTIVDSNLTTLITAYFLFQIGSGPVKGFGITLAIGIIASMFTALYVTRTLFAVLLKKGILTEAKMRGSFKTRSIPWMSYRRKAGTISAVAVLAGFVLFAAVPETKKFDLDFTEGSKLVLRFHKEVALKDIEQRLATLQSEHPEFADVSVRLTSAGLGAKVSDVIANGCELRSQKISTQTQIDGFVTALRKTFKNELMPGPLQATMQPAATGGGTVATLYLVDSGISPVLVQEAFRQHADREGGGDLAPLTGANVTAAKAVPGAGSVFDLALRESPTKAAQTVIQIHAALKSYDHKLAKEYFSDEVTRDDVTASREAEAKAALAVLEGIEKIDTAHYFHASDPIPLADRIDPFSAKQHRNNAIQAIAFSILGIIAYVAFRFRSWAFGFAAIVAIVHDVAVVLGVVAIANWLGLVDARLNLVTVAAFLTLIGYSINDTIVVFDRIRENRGAGGRTRLSDTIDKSINQTLTRTLRTTTTTWVVVLLLLVMNWGAQSSLEGFAFILVIGVLVGTYSSIFIASPTVIFLPWLWEKYGGSVKSFSKKAGVYAAACAVLLLALDFAIGGVEGDGSLAVFNNLMLGIPAGLMMLFIVNYLRWLRIDDVKETPAVA